MGNKPHVKPVSKLTTDLRCPRCLTKTPHYAGEHRGRAAWKCAKCSTLHREGQVLWKGGRGKRWGRPTPPLKRYLLKKIRELHEEIDARPDAWGKGRPRNAR